MSIQHDPTASDGADAVELMRGFRLAAIALVSAVVTATLVIGIGGAWLDRSAQAAQASVDQTAPALLTAR
jgi:flagellar basal body-associated protein FliL